MRRLIELHKHTLSSFLEQRKDLLLVVPASDSDAVILLQLTSELDVASGEDLFVTIGGEFDDADGYALAAAELFVRQHALAAAAVLEAGKPALPDPPATLLLPGRPGQERLRELCAFAHGLLPPEARRLVLVVAPTRIADRAAFLALVGYLTPRPERERWMARLRLIVRDVPPSLAPDEREHPLARVTTATLRVAPVDFSQDAIRRSLAETAEDESAPLAERMSSLLAASIVDGIHGEQARALQGFDRVLGYYQAEKNTLMQAVTVNAMGEVNQGAGKLEQARHWFECALLLAVQSENAFSLCTVARNLGVLCASLGDHESAARYFDGLAQIAPKILDNETLSWALEQRGASEAALGKHEAAIETWERGATLCRNTDHDVGLQAHLARLSEARAARDGQPPLAGEPARVEEVGPHG
jgi:tetratricopeptide (TPR) repeat protein